MQPLAPGWPTGCQRRRSLILVAVRMLYDVVGVLLLNRPEELTGHAVVPPGLWFLLLVLGIGLATGVLSGLLGVGGGVVMVPAMVFLLGFTQTLAQGISLAVIIPTAVSGGVVHYRQGNIRLHDVLWLAAGGMAGAFAGSFLAVRLDVLILRGLFGLLLLVLGVSMVWRHHETSQNQA
ncbi:MAG: TSUP family transporter [Armatimonadota bacterium]